jgi:serine/threonine protein kinase
VPCGKLGIHQQGVRHKDIKSRNILLKDGNVLYADFGPSKIFESELTSLTTGTVNSGNTPMYSAPEVMAHQKRSRSADIFSLGCVFTEILTVSMGRKLATYHEFRKTKFLDEWGGAYESCAYHKTLDKVDEWFSDSSSNLYGQSAYKAFIRPMLAVERDARPTASEVAHKIREHYRFGSLSEGCEWCNNYINMIWPWG